MSDITCANCGASNREGAKYCITCGFSLAPSSLTTLVMDEAMLRPAAAHTRPLPPAAPLPDYSPPPPVRRSNGTPTTPLTPTREPLPEGALLADDRYVIRQPLDGPPGRFLYHADDLGAAPYGPSCLIIEGDETALAGELAARRLAAGDGLRPPYDAFTLGRRAFVVCAGGRPFDELTWPVEPAQALSWGAALARGLAVVHDAGLAFGDLDGQRVLSDGETLYLADFSSAAAAAPGAAEQDVRALAGLAHRMLTGQADSAPGGLPSAERLAALMAGRQTMNASQLAALLAAGQERLRRPESLDLRIGRRTDVGQLRELNEDSLLTLDLVWSNKSITRPLGLFVVADGMGGHEGGEIASGLLVRTIAQHAAGELMPRTTAAGGEPMDYGAWLSSAIQAGNVAVYERSQKAHNDMGTTVVAALVAGDEVYVAHVGDSRAYRIGPDGIEQLTVDHSLVESLIASNQITRDEARNHPQSNVIYRTIGDKRQVMVDLIVTSLGVGESLLLCSDGLSGMLTDEAMRQIVTAVASPQEACDALIEAANRAGGEDNVTAVVVRVEALG